MIFLVVGVPAFVVNHGALPFGGDAFDVSDIPLSRTVFTLRTVVYIDTEISS